MSDYISLEVSIMPMLENFIKQRRLTEDDITPKFPKVIILNGSASSGITSVNSQINNPFHYYNLSHE